MVCFGLFRGKKKPDKKRGSSLPPPVGSKASTEPPARNLDLYKSLPFIPKDETTVQDEPESKNNDQFDSRASYGKTTSEINDQHIIPAPKSFQETNSKSSELLTSSEASETVSKIIKSHELEKKYTPNSTKDLQGENSLKNSLKKSARDDNSQSRSITQKQQKSIISQAHSVHFENNDPASTSKSLHLQQNENIDLNETAESSFNKSIQMNLSYHENSVSYNNDVVVNTNTIQKLVETYNSDKNVIKSLQLQNENYQLVIENFQQQALQRETTQKEQNDEMIKRIQEVLYKETKSDEEKESIKHYFISKQQEVNENLIKEQNSIIESLQTKCHNYQNDLKNVGKIDVSNQDSIKELSDEIVALRDIVHHLNIELSQYQAKNPIDNLKKLERGDLSGLPNRSPTPIWLVSTKYLSPLIAVYDERIKDKDEKLKLLKKKIDDLTSKFKMILDENSQLHLKCENMQAGGKGFDSNDLKEFNEIRHHAMLVLEENQVLRENQDILQKRVLDIQKSHIQEVGNLSKKVILAESDKTDLKNQIETLNFNNEDLSRKYNEVFAEVQKRVTLQDHLRQTSDLNRKIEDDNLLYKQEIEDVMNKLKNLQMGKKELSIKYAQLVSDNKKLYAENKVLDKALNEGIGRKTQRKLQTLEKKLEIAEHNHKSSKNDLTKLVKEAEKLQVEKEAFKNLAKSNELQLKKGDNKRVEENLQIAKLEDKLQNYKEKSTQKISSILHKVKRKESEYFLNKLESEKKVSDVLNLLHKKQDELDIYVREKRQLESEIEFIWQATSTENRNLKESLLQNRSLTASQHRLLLDD